MFTLTFQFHFLTNRIISCRPRTKVSQLSFCESDSSRLSFVGQTYWKHAWVFLLLLLLCVCLFGTTLAVVIWDSTLNGCPETLRAVPVGAAFGAESEPQKVEVSTPEGFPSSTLTVSKSPSQELEEASGEVGLGRSVLIKKLILGWLLQEELWRSD